jgi:hypothetical protein
MRPLDRIVDWWMSRCQHDGADVAADILEGDWMHHSVQYCRRCGAVRVKNHRPGARERMHSEWRRPRPLWCEAAR